MIKYICECVCVVGVLFHYEDGYYFMYYPHELLPDDVKERHSSGIQEFYKDKLLLEPGMKVRVKWSKSIRIAKATVYAVDEDHAKLISLVSRLESEQKLLVRIELQAFIASHRQPF